MIKSIDYTEALKKVALEIANRAKDIVTQERGLRTINVSINVTPTDLPNYTVVMEYYPEMLYKGDIPWRTEDEDNDNE